MHITQCQEVGQQMALDTAIQSLADWMALLHTDPLLREAVVTFLHHRGSLCWSDIMSNYPHRYQALGNAQDLLGWDCFLSGMISTKVQHIQADHLSTSASRTSLRLWMKQFITQVLQITHGQWVYRNEVVHNATSGTNCIAKKQ